MIAFLFVSALNRHGANPLDALPSPVILHRASNGTSDWVAANRALDELRRLPRRDQISCELEYISECQRLYDPKHPYNWRPRYDVGKLDVIAIAKGTRPMLQPARHLSFLQRTPGVVYQVRRNFLAGAYREASFDLSRPTEVMQTATFRVARARVRRGYYVLTPADGSERIKAEPRHTR